MPLVTHNAEIERFISKINLGVEFFHEAGMLLVKMFDADPNVFDEIITVGNEPWLTKDVLETFLAIGRKQLAVEAMFLPRHVLSRLLALPADQQLAIATQPVEVVTGMRQGRPCVIQKRAAKLTRPEAARALGPSGIRAPSEQAKMIKVEMTKEISGEILLPVRAFVVLAMLEVSGDPKGEKTMLKVGYRPGYTVLKLEEIKPDQK